MKKVLYLKHENYEVLISMKDLMEQFLNENGKFGDIMVQFDFNPMNGF